LYQRHGRKVDGGVYVEEIARLGDLYLQRAISHWDTKAENWTNFIKVGNSADP